MSLFDSDRSLLENLPVVGLSPSAPLEPGRAFRESLPVVGLLFLWTLLSWVVFEPFVARRVRETGLVMALGYVAVRGFQLGEDATPLTVDSVPAVLGQSVHAAVVPGVWFLAAALVPVLGDLWGVVGLPGAFTSPIDDFVRVCALTGLGTAMLLVVAGATAALARPTRPPSVDTGE